MKIDVLFSESTQSFQMNMTESEQSIGVDFGQIQIVTKTVCDNPYLGEYVVTPKMEAQTLPTKEKGMLDDVTIREIPVFRVSNNSGGTTVYIAKEV